METNKTVQFVYNFQNYDGQPSRIEYPIVLPYRGDIRELSYEIVAKQMDPIMKMLDAHEELYKHLRIFVDKENQDFFCNRDEDLLNKARNGQIDIDQLIREAEKHCKEEVIEYAEKIGPTDEDIFAQSFHRLVHSPLLPEILIKEKAYAKTISEMIVRMDKEIASLNDRQAVEMENKIEQLDVSTTSEDINNLLSQQYSTQNMIRQRWESELEARKGHQKNEYKNWIIGQVGETLCSSSTLTAVGNRSSMFVSMQTPSMEESFTIHLGSQLKHMHNIRILSADINDLCSPLHSDDESISGLNMALGLYSSSLCGIVVLTPSGSVQVNSKIIKNFQMSTEFHFDEINTQIDKIQTELSKSTGSPSKHAGKLKSGDFFITRHSNLSQTHIIFHLISDEPFNSPDEINSRHPVILGLRNILKTASKHDVTVLTIPALLRHEMSEDMTVPWCTRRAELVFKCAKGFMIESATWGGAELSTLQLLLPRDISEDLFNTLVSMVPHVFRVANPKIFQESANDSGMP
ncbi:hypothetical protein HA402_013614 [Bradysia odoriphaga]|nr:hypothetical protein HA402_013614 [Bradysia odoriphaga]